MRSESIEILKKTNTVKSNHRYSNISKTIEAISKPFAMMLRCSNKYLCGYNTIPYNHSDSVNTNLSLDFNLDLSLNS